MNSKFGDVWYYGRVRIKNTQIYSNNFLIGLEGVVILDRPDRDVVLVLVDNHLDDYFYRVYTLKRTDLEYI